MDHKIFNFFIEILSYCALNKQKGINIYADLRNKDLLPEIKDWIGNIFYRLHFYDNHEQPKLIYFYFPDRKTVSNLDKLFNDYTLPVFSKYFEACSNKIEQSYKNNNFEFFSFINFFHLIGSFRYFSSDDDKNQKKISEQLQKVLKNKKMHPLIKYSTLQITTIIEIEPDNNPNNYYNKQLVEKEFNKQLKLLDENALFSKYISFYSMYYYNNEFSPKELIVNSLNKIIKDDSISFSHLYNFIPQILSQMNRLKIDKYREKSLKKNLIALLKITESSNIDKIIEFKNDIKRVA